MTEQRSNSMAVDNAIRHRCTIKVLSEIELPVNDNSLPIVELVEVAGWAPFHRGCDAIHRESGLLKGIEPWRFYVLDGVACRKLRLRLPAAISGKIPAMLASAEALIMATWLPNPPAKSSTENVLAPSSPPDSVPSEFVPDYPANFEATIANMEHIAAASAAVQNLLVAATARGIDNYWSSGGVLRSPAAFDMLEIPRREILLGAIFLFPSESPGAERVGSKLREHRTRPEHWSRQVTIA